MIQLEPKQCRWCGVAVALALLLACGTMVAVAATAPRCERFSPGTRVGNMLVAGCDDAAVRR